MDVGECCQNFLDFPYMVFKDLLLNSDSGAVVLFLPHVSGDPGYTGRKKTHLMDNSPSSCGHPTDTISWKEMYKSLKLQYGEGFAVQLPTNVLQWT